MSNTLALDMLMEENAKLRKAVAELLTLVSTSWDPPQAILAVMCSPAERLRAQANEIERKDAIILNARNLL